MYVYMLLYSEEQFHTLISILGENSPFNAKGWQLQYKNYYGKGVGWCSSGNSNIVYTYWYLSDIFLFFINFSLSTILFLDRKLNNFFIGNFEKFLHKNPGALWQAQALQKKFMQYNIGPRYWEDKMEQFRLTREDLGVRLI